VGFRLLKRNSNLWTLCTTGIPASATTATSGSATTATTTC
jgi:hypothetical protein